MNKRDAERQDKKNELAFNQAILRVLWNAQVYRSTGSKRTKNRCKRAGLRSLESALSLL